jgi:hypothetical protein
MQMVRYAGVISFFVLPLLVAAAENPSALDAIEVLPKDEMKSLARIIAYDGTPVPERWHFLVHDPNSASGVREYVVAKGELVAARGISQFAQRLTEADVIGKQLLQVDTDELAKLANAYATANKLAITKLTYRLSRLAQTPEPQWQVNCIDDTGKTLGTLFVTATQGNVVSHAGFSVAPVQQEEQRLTRKRDTEPVTAKKRIAAATTEPERESSEAVNTPKKTTTADSTKRTPQL